MVAEVTLAPWWIGSRWVRKKQKKEWERERRRRIRAGGRGVKNMRENETRVLASNASLQRTASQGWPRGFIASPNSFSS